ncbi:MAG: ankyrin repeat domain-containing protein [Candidatus Babeliales bacterium]
MKKIIVLAILFINIIPIQGYEGIWPSDANELTLAINNTINPNEKDQNGDTLLHRAVKLSNLEPTVLLLNKNADPNIQNNNGETPLHAFTKGSTNLQIFLGPTTLQEANLNNAKLLLESNANPNIIDNNGNTPLHIALMFNIPYLNSLIDMLFFYKANPLIQNNAGNTPLHIAAIHNKTPRTIFRILFEALTYGTPVDAYLNIKNQEGKTPAQVASSQEIRGFLMNRDYLNKTISKIAKELLKKNKTLFDILSTREITGKK